MPKHMHKLQYLRKRKGLTQEDMAALLGMTVHGYRKYEQGIRKLSLEMALRIVKILELEKVEELIDEAS